MKPQDFYLLSARIKIMYKSQGDPNAVVNQITV